MDENENNIFHTNSKNDNNNSFLENSFIDKSNLKRKFNTDFICSSINESFSLNSNIKRKKLDEINNSIIQKQIEFAFKAQKDNYDDERIIGVPKKEIKSKLFQNDSKFGEKTQKKKKKKKLNKGEEEQKIIFGVPKEPIISEPLPDNICFGVKKEEKKEKKEEKKEEIIHNLFGAQKEDIKSESLRDHHK